MKPISTAERFLSLARELDQAQSDCQQIEPITNAHTDLTISDAYVIQRELVGLKLNQGSRVTGKKVGFTSPVVQQKLGIDEPGFGYLFSGSAIEHEGQIPLDRLLQPKLEPEIAFVMNDTLRGPGLTLADVLSATEYLVP